MIEEIIVKRKGAKYEAVGFLLIVSSMGGCSVGLAFPGQEALYLGGSGIMFFVGICVFLYGRF